MNERNDGGPAFPTTPVNNGYDNSTFGPGTGSGTGLSARDWFAGMAMLGLVASGEWRRAYDQETGAIARQQVGDVAYRMADAMLEAGKNEKSPAE